MYETHTLMTIMTIMTTMTIISWPSWPSRLSQPSWLNKYPNAPKYTPKYPQITKNANKNDKIITKKLSPIGYEKTIDPEKTI